MLDLIITGENNVFSKALIQVMGLFYENTDFFNPLEKKQILQRSKNRPTGIIAVFSSNKTSDMTNSLFQLLNSTPNLAEETKWINIDLKRPNANVPYGIPFPPNLIEILNALESKDYGIKPLSLEEKILINKKVLMEKIGMFKHNLQNKIPTCIAICEKKREAYRKHKDFNRLKEETGKFIENTKSNRSYTYTIGKGALELIKTFSECGIDFENTFMESYNCINKRTKKISNFWDNFHKDEDLENLYMTMEDLSEDLDRLKNSLETFPNKKNND